MTDYQNGEAEDLRRTDAASEVNETDSAADLRRRAEQSLLQRMRGLEQLHEHDIMALIHELQVHQVELEMQNEELRRAQFELQTAAERFSSLYDHAPVGYLTLDEDGVIHESNITFLRQLGAAKAQVIRSPLTRYIHRDDQSEFFLFRRRLLQDRELESCEVRLKGPGAEEFWGHLEAVRWPGPEQGRIWRVAISDVTETRRATEFLRRLTEELERRVEERTRRLAETNRQLLDEIDQRRQVERLLRNREEELEQRVNERTRSLQSLLEISHNVVSTLQLQQVVGLILDHLQQAIGYSGCAVYLLDNDNLRVLDYRGHLPREAALRLELPLSATAGMREVVARGTPMIIDDLAAGTPGGADWRHHAHPAQVQLLGNARSWMAVPLLAKARVIGALRLDHERPGYFTDQHAHLAMAIANQTAVAVENARLYQQAQQLAAMEERQRLARDLHDSVAQTFYSIALSAQTLKDRNQGHDSRVVGLIDRILNLCEAGMAELRGVIFALRPEALDREGLVRGLERQITALRVRDDVTIESDLGQEPDAAIEIKEALYRIAQEALRNMARHASATHATVRLRREDGYLHLEVTDDGLGFDTGTHYPGLGLRSIRERVERLNGTLELDVHRATAPGSAFAYWRGRKDKIVARRDMVVIGASAGGHEALAQLCTALPGDFPAAVLIVWHMPSYGLGLLPTVMAPGCRLPVANAENGETIIPGRVYVAPPDHHMLVEDGHIRLTKGPKENRFRPAVDPLFRSAAHAAGPRAIGVVLTGALDDGTSGLWAIKDQGGVAVAQDPLDAAFPGMPQSAINNVAVDYIVPLGDMGELLTHLTNEEIEDGPRFEEGQWLEQDIRGATMARHDEQDMERMGNVSVFTCPECHGSLWKIEEGKILRFRCRTGHAYTAQALLEDLSEDVEDTLWTAVRSLEEKASLMQNIAWHLRGHGDESADHYLREAAAALRRATTVREALTGAGGDGAEDNGSDGPEPGAGA